MKTEILIEKNLRIIYNRPLTEDFLLKAGQWLPKFNWNETVNGGLKNVQREIMIFQPQFYMTTA